MLCDEPAEGDAIKDWHCFRTDFLAGRQEACVSLARRQDGKTARRARQARRQDGQDAKTVSEEKSRRCAGGRGGGRGRIMNPIVVGSLVFPSPFTLSA